MDRISDAGMEFSTYVDVKVNMRIIVNARTLAKEPLDTNEKTVGNMNAGIDIRTEKEKYLGRSIRPLEVSASPRIVLG